MSYSLIGLPSQDFLSSCSLQNPKNLSWGAYIQENVLYSALVCRGYLGDRKAYACAVLMGVEREFSLMNLNCIHHPTLVRTREAFLSTLVNLQDTVKWKYSVELIEAYLEGLDWIVQDSELQSSIKRLVNKNLGQVKHQQGIEETSIKIYRYITRNQEDILSLRGKIGSLWLEVRKEFSGFLSNLSPVSYQISLSSSLSNSITCFMDCINTSMKEIEDVIRHVE